MFKIKYAAAAVGTLMLLGAALPASAAGLTSSQISSILSLLQAFGVDQTTINNVSAALGSTLKATPTCNIWASPSSVVPGQSVTFNWISSSAVSVSFVVVGNEFNYGGQKTYGLPTYGSMAATAPQTTGTKIITLNVLGNGAGNSCQTQAVVTSTTQPSATIDQSSLTGTVSVPPIIFGGASNTSSVRIKIGDGYYGNVTIPVINGRWVHTFPAVIPEGSFLVSIL